ncbi:zinc finger protein without children isoform X2 [Lycorma delicatula]|uniref:zinc finger protein without children isoform X2 n=1 Tax=Lycorma delicatula TaxID=130591 RepID=UPI003F50D528
MESPGLEVGSGGVVAKAVSADSEVFSGSVNGDSEHVSSPTATSENVNNTSNVNDFNESDSNGVSSLTMNNDENSQQEKQSVMCSNVNNNDNNVCRLNNLDSNYSSGSSNSDSNVFNNLITDVNEQSKKLSDVHSEQISSTGATDVERDISDTQTRVNDDDEDDNVLNEAEGDDGILAGNSDNVPVMDEDELLRETTTDADEVLTKELPSAEGLSDQDNSTSGHKDDVNIDNISSLLETSVGNNESDRSLVDKNLGVEEESNNESNNKDILKDLCDNSNASSAAISRDHEDSNPPLGTDETSLNLSETGVGSGSECERTRFLHCDDTVNPEDVMDVIEVNAVDPFAQTIDTMRNVDDRLTEMMEVDSEVSGTENKQIDNSDMETTQTRTEEMDVTEIDEKQADKTKVVEQDIDLETSQKDMDQTKMAEQDMDTTEMTAEETASDVNNTLITVSEKREDDKIDSNKDDTLVTEGEKKTLGTTEEKTLDVEDGKTSQTTEEKSDEKDSTYIEKESTVVNEKETEDKSKDDSTNGPDKTIEESSPAVEADGDEDVCIIPDTVPRVPNDATVVSSMSNKLKSILSKSDRNVIKNDLKEDSTDSQVSSRPQRQAAKRADAQIKATVQQLDDDDGEKENDEIDLEGEDDDDDDDDDDDSEEMDSVTSVTDTSQVQQPQQMCQQCCRMKVCKYKILSQGKVLSYLCSEVCSSKYQELLDSQRKEAVANKNAARNSVITSQQTVNDNLTVTGGLPAKDINTEKPSQIPQSDIDDKASDSTTSEQNESLETIPSATIRRPTRRVDNDGEFIRICSQCSSDIKQDDRTLSWETMDFCNEGCLGKYQTSLGSHCAYCKKSVQTMSLGKYCVRFGYDIRQFCCASCLEEFKKGLKVCSYCQKDISSSFEGFLAPVGDKGQFKDFCTQSCMEKYDQMSTNQRPPPQIYPCDVCKNNKLVQVEVLMDSKTSKLCSEVCFAAFKFVNTIKVDQCDMCRKYFDRANSSTENFCVYYEDAQHNFCCKTCMNVYILAKRKIVPCNWCKVKKYNFDMIKRVMDNKQVLMMCSLNCLTLYQVSVNAVSSRRIKCDSCGSVSQAQYHLTMSDATIRNFCNYNCVMKFQAQYNKSPITLPGGQPATPIPTGVPKRVVPVTTGAVTTLSASNDAAGVPVISSVTSLAGQSSGQVLSHSGVSDGTAVKQINSLPPVQMSNGASTSTGGNVSGPVPVSLSTAATPVIPGVTPVVPPAGGVQSPYHVIIKPPQPTKMSNRSSQCRPYMHTKGVSCRPHACVKQTQTDLEADGTKVIIPVPVPIYIPAPMHMYTLPTPCPLPIPLPVPVPIFIPTTRGSAKGIMKEIKKIQEKIPTDPFEAELLMMAEMVAEQKKQEDSSDSEDDTTIAPEAAISATASSSGTTGPSNDVAGPGANNTSSLNASDVIEGNSNAFGSDEMIVQMALKMATEMDDQSNSSPPVDLEAELPPNTITTKLPTASSSSSTSSRSNHAISENEEDVDDPEPVIRESRGRKRVGRPPGSGRRSNSSSSTPPVKRPRKSSSASNRASTPNETPSQPAVQIPADKPDANMCLKFTFGVNAWKQWVTVKNAELEKTTTATPGGNNNRKVKLFKSDILQLTADELNYSLCLFIKEARKPNGSTYAPDTIFYFCLGIQQYLFENGRIDNIFTDAYYEKFTECLDEVAKVFSDVCDDSKFIVTRVEEEHLWESKQLGAHSPHVLLSTLMFFNTKHFNLTSVDEHMQLSFSHIMKHWKRNPNQPGTPGSSSGKVAPGSRNVLLRFYPPQSALDAPNSKKKKVYEQQENEENPLRCPVKLYEFYLSKCPESVKTRNDVFYLLPERSCVPDSPVWYSTMALGKEPLLKMLHRIKMVKEINIALRST